jgi:hypothetical protein
MWRRIEADGCEWEVRAIARAGGERGRPGEVGEILEFRPLDRLRPPRQVAVAEGSLAAMDEAQLHAAYRRSRPVGGDHYGRPGKRMPDTAD